jgi:hypothetical protein
LLCLVTSADHFRGAVFAIVASARSRAFRKSGAPGTANEAAFDHKTRACARAFPSRLNRPRRVFADNQSNLLPISLFPHRDSRCAVLGSSPKRALEGWLPVRKAIGPGNGGGLGLQIRETLAAFYLMSQVMGLPFWPRDDGGEVNA